MVGNDETMTGHRASLERDLAAVRKQGCKRSRHLAIEIEEKSKYISREMSRFNQLSEDIEKAKTELETRATAPQVEAGRLVELRAELARVPHRHGCRVNRTRFARCSSLIGCGTLPREACFERESRGRHSDFDRSKAP